MRHKLRVANIRHCRYCIPIHQAAQLSRADPGVSRAFLYIITVNDIQYYTGVDPGIQLRGRDDGERFARAYNGPRLGQSPQRGLGAEPLVRGANGYLPP